MYAFRHSTIQQCTPIICMHTIYAYVHTYICNENYQCMCCRFHERNLNVEIIFMSIKHQQRLGSCNLVFHQVCCAIRISLRIRIVHVFQPTYFIISIRIGWEISVTATNLLMCICIVLNLLNIQWIFTEYFPYGSYHLPYFHRYHDFSSEMIDFRTLLNVTE